MGKLGEVLSRPEELVPLASMFLAAKRAKILPRDPSLAFCYDMLNRVSRSFAVVIQQLPVQLRDAICVFYLVLRALDTVEDDMAIPEDIKVPLLRCFHEKSYNRGWSMDCGAGEYRRLMQQYPLVSDAFLRLHPKFQEVIADICKRMGNGMADFIPQEVKTVEQYELYCHYVAGLVGIGLSHLFASSGLEIPEFFRLDAEANQMGLFLQKTNIIRDYLEDISEEPAPRMFWPREIWGRYAQDLAAFKEPQNAEAAVAALNDMEIQQLRHLPCSMRSVGAAPQPATAALTSAPHGAKQGLPLSPSLHTKILNALCHIETCLRYMSKLQDKAVLRFCAIPQIMAMATLQLCYNNHAVFTGVVKMRRGEVARIMYHLDDHADTLILFRKSVAAAEGVEQPDKPQSARVSVMAGGKEPGLVDPRALCFGFAGALAAKARQAELALQAQQAGATTSSDGKAAGGGSQEQQQPGEDGSQPALANGSLGAHHSREQDGRAVGTAPGTTPGAAATGAAALAARQLEVHQQVVAACAKVVAVCEAGVQELEAQDGARRLQEQTAPVDVFGRVAVMVLAVGYSAYAWYIEEGRLALWKVRHRLGLPVRDANGTLDALNRVLAAMFLAYAMWVALTGKRV
ncbi:hypothetical protein N2152v2_003243 [Parachlorella kessleri]